MKKKHIKKYRNEVRCAIASETVAGEISEYNAKPISGKRLNKIKANTTEILQEVTGRQCKYWLVGKPRFNFNSSRDYIIWLEWDSVANLYYFGFGIGKS